MKSIRAWAITFKGRPLLQLPGQTRAEIYLTGPASLAEHVRYVHKKMKRSGQLKVVRVEIRFLEEL